MLLNICDGAGHLRVPLVRARGISLPDGMEESLTQHKSYLRRQYNIKVSTRLTQPSSPHTSELRPDDISGQESYPCW